MSLASKFKVNAVYSAFMGEQNCRGIGAPVLFLRLQGCHLRCYKKTLGELCDTPEGLTKDGGTEMRIDEIIDKLTSLRISTGIDLICLSGGDPLWNDQEALSFLLTRLTTIRFTISVESSGTLSMEPYRYIKNVHWVLDYKVKSAGLKAKFQFSDIKLLDNQDFIKFVLYDEADYQEALQVIPQLYAATYAKIAVGPYWGGKLGIMELYQKLVSDGLAGNVVLNVQLHKLAIFADAHSELIAGTMIPQKI